MTSPDSTIWYKSLATFFSKHNVTKIWIGNDDSFATKLNAFLRFALYYGVLMSIAGCKSWPLALPIVVALLTYLIYENASLATSYVADDSRGKRADVTVGSVHNSGITYPTVRNPVMNFTLNDMLDNPQRSTAANVMDLDVKRRMAHAYQAGVPHDARDVFGRNTGERTFYTMPCTAAVNDADVFARWLFRPSEDVTWKEQAVLRHK
jgi:hypothetical protein